MFIRIKQKTKQGINACLLKFIIPNKDICFVTGCPRSGTTAMIHWLSRSCQVAAFDEPRLERGISQFMDFINGQTALHNNKQMLHVLMKRLFYDYFGSMTYIWNKKMIAIKDPMSSSDESFIDNLRELFPGVKIIFMVRNPVSVFNSMNNKLWGYSRVGGSLEKMSLERGMRLWKFSAQQLIKFMSYKDYHEWFYVCKYENLVADPKSETEKIQNFLKIRKPPVFEVNKSAEITLEPSIIKVILSETAREREFLNYTDS